MLLKLGIPQARVDAETRSIEPLLKQNRELKKLEKSNFFFNRDIFVADYVLPESILGVYNSCPLKLVEDGFDPHLLRSMDIGYDQLNHRIMYPLRDLYGNLAGFSGGVTPHSVRPHPKYLVYQGSRKGNDNRWIRSDFGPWFDDQFPDYRCENHEFLWNYDKVFKRFSAMSDPKVTVYVVEGFKACLWMLQAGFWNTVALMGSYISDRQQRLLHRLGGTVVLFLDNDSAGRRATFNVGGLLWGPMYRKVRVVPYPNEDVRNSLDGDEDEPGDSQPDDYEVDAVKTLVNRSMPFTDYMNYATSFGILQSQGQTNGRQRIST